MIFILFKTNVQAKDCLSFLPFGYNGQYTHLPLNSSFCVKEDNIIKNYLTDSYGGRILKDEFSKDFVEVFGDSQVLGLDIINIKDHYLNSYYKKNLKIYAAPNNGPYEVLNFLHLNHKIIKNSIIVTFNFSVDIYRLSADWDPKNVVALNSDDLDEILKNPLKYKFIIFKNFLFNKNFTLARNNNEEMQRLFINSNKEKIINQLKIYYKNLDQVAKKYNLNIEYIITHPYWLYDKNNDGKLFLNQTLLENINIIICESFKPTKNINKILVSHLYKELNLKDLTFDKRHLKSNKIKLFKLNNICE